MNFEDLRYFAEAARKGNHRQAARALSITPSALSHSIKRLQEELGIELFAKTGRNVRLTDGGKALVEKAERVLEQVSTIKRDLAPGRCPLPPVIRAGAVTGEPSRLLVKAWSGVPGLRPAGLQMLSLRSSEIVQKISKRELEFGFCFSPQPYPDVATVVIATTKTVVAVRKGHPLTRVSKRNQLEHLADYRYAGTNHLPGVSSCTDHPIFKSLGREPKASLLYDTYDTAQAMVEHCDGWAILPRTLVREAREKLTAILPSLAGELQLALIYNAANPFDGVREALSAALRETCLDGGWEPGTISPRVGTN